MQAAPGHKWFGTPRPPLRTPGIAVPGDRESQTLRPRTNVGRNDDNQPGAPNRCFEATSAAALGALLERANLKQPDRRTTTGSSTIAADSRLPDQASDLIRGAMHRRG